MLAAVNPKTMTVMEMRISLAIETVEGDISKECLIFRLLKATACLTPPSDKSIFWNPSLINSSHCSRILP
jgi:hypothetical protein